MMSEPALIMIIYVFSFIVAVVVGHLVVRMTLNGMGVTTGTEGINGAGAIIGILERIFVWLFVLLGQYSAIPLIIGAKSLARFKELDERRFAEYFLIGTLLSLLMAVAGALIAVVLVGMVS